MVRQEMVVLFIFLTLAAGHSGIALGTSPQVNDDFVDFLKDINNRVFNYSEDVTSLSFYESVSLIFQVFIAENEVTFTSLETKEQAMEYADWLDEKCRWNSSNPDKMYVVVSALWLKSIASSHSDCIRELKNKSFLQNRCSQRCFKLALQRLQIIGAWRFSQMVFDEAKEMRGRDSRVLIGWTNQMQTPTVWIPNLWSSSNGWWDCHSKKYPSIQNISEQLVSNYEVIRKEVASAPLMDYLTPASPALFAQGDWRELPIFRRLQYIESACQLLPETCAVLGELPFPTKLDIPDAAKEEALIFSAGAGTKVPYHSGDTNAIINIQLPLTALEGASLTVGAVTKGLEYGKTLCFDDSFIHSVEHNGAAQRLVLQIRVMHPDVTPAHYHDDSVTDVGESKGKTTSQYSVYRF